MLERDFNRRILAELELQLQLARRGGVTVKQLASRLDKHDNFWYGIRRDGRIAISTLLRILRILSLDRQVFFYHALDPAWPILNFAREIYALGTPPPRIAQDVLARFLGNIPGQRSFEAFFPVRHQSVNADSIDYPNFIDEAERERYTRPQAVIKDLEVFIESELSAPDAATPRKAFLCSATLGVMASCYRTIGEIDQAHHILAAAIKLTYWHGWRWLEGRHALRAVSIISQKGAIVSSGEMLEFARRHFSLLGDTVRLANVSILEGHECRQKKNFGAAARFYKQALRRLPRSETLLRVAAIHALADVELQSGNLGIAYKYAKEAKSLAESLDSFTRAMTTWQTAKLAAATGDVRASNLSFEAAMTALRSIPQPLQEVRLLLDWIELNLFSRHERAAIKLALQLQAYLTVLAKWRIIRDALEETICAAKMRRLSVELLTTCKSTINRYLGQIASRRRPPKWPRCWQSELILTTRVDHSHISNRR